MKKIFITLIAFAMLASIPNSRVFAASEQGQSLDKTANQTTNQTDYIAILTKKGFFDRVSTNFSNPYDSIKKILSCHLKFANKQDFEGLMSLYSEDFVNADGLNRDLYFDLIKKTWASYPDIKYKMSIKNVQVTGKTATAQVNEYAVATTDAKSGMLEGKGLLKSQSSSVYYFKCERGRWKIISDYIVYEKTYLGYGDAKTVSVELDAPNQILAGSEYTATLNMNIPKDTLVIASIGQEKITYPQTPAPEIFRKMSSEGILERIFTANADSINEYNVASFGMTKAEIKDGAEIKIYITGLGFMMSRVNVIPFNNYITPEDEQTDLKQAEATGAVKEKDADQT